MCFLIYLLHLNVQVTPIPVRENESETIVRKTEVKEWSRVSPLSRSKSLESLPRHRPTGTTALRALYESKSTSQPESKKSKTALESASAEKANYTTLPKYKDAEDTKSQVEAEVNNSHNEQEKVTEEIQVITKVNSWTLQRCAFEQESFLLTDKINTLSECKNKADNKQIW